MTGARRSVGWWLVLAAFVLRAGWVGYRWQARGATLEYPDEELHWQLAANLFNSGTLVADDGRLAARMPLYPLFLAIFAGLGPTGILVAKLVQAALGALTVGVAQRLARAVLSSRAAVVAGLLIGCDPFGIFFANLLLSETLFTLLLMGFIACAWRLGDDGGRMSARVGLAVLGPALILTRPSAAALVPLIWLVAAWGQTRGRAAAPPAALAGASGSEALCGRPRAPASLRGCVESSLCLCPVLLALVLLPWGLRNREALGSFAWLSTNGGVTLYDAQGPQADGSSNQDFLLEMPELQGLDEVALDRTLTQLAWRQVQRDPARVVRLAGIKLLRMWNPLPNVAEYRGGAAAWAGATYTLVVLLAAVVRLIQVFIGGAKRSGLRRLHLLLWAPILYFTLLHCVYIGSVRYRVPLMPLLAIGAASVVTSSTSRNAAAD